MKADAGSPLRHVVAAGVLPVAAYEDLGQDAEQAGA